MILTALARLGKDAEARFTPKGEAVANLALAINYGRKDESGNRPTQWVDASLWGKRAESLTPYLLKGTLLYVALEEPHIETYEGKLGTGSKMVARVISIEFAGGKSDRQAEAPRQAAPQPARQPQPKQEAAQGSGFDDFTDDIPF